MKTVQKMVALLIALGTLTFGVLIAPAQAQAQEATLRWTTSGVGFGDLSVAPTTITDAGGSGIDVTVTFSGNVCGGGSENFPQPRISNTPNSQYVASGEPFNASSFITWTRINVRPTNNDARVCDGDVQNPGFIEYTFSKPVVDLRFRVNNVDRQVDGPGGELGFQDEVIFFTTLGNNDISNTTILTPGTSASPIIFQNQDGSFGAFTEEKVVYDSDAPEASVLVQVPLALDRIRISARSIHNTEHRLDFGDLAFTPLYQVTLTTDPTNGGTVTGDGTYQAGDNVCLTATPAAGFEFIGWTQGGEPVSLDSEGCFTMPAEDQALVANFVPIVAVLYQVTLSTVPTDGGTVTGDGPYSEGDTVSLTATPAAGFVFVNWTDENGNVESSDSSYTFTMPARDRALVANFVPIVPVPTLNPLGILLLMLTLIGIVAVQRSRQRMLNQ